MTGRFLSLIIFLCLMTQVNVYAQKSDSIPPKKKPKVQVAENGMVKDSARLAFEARPRIAVRRSAIFPGLGQIYNKRWWKVPLVYGGFVGIGLVYEFNQRNYKIFLEEAQARAETGKPKNPDWAVYSDEGIINVKDYHRRNRDLSVLAGLGFYAIQMIDAYVDAKFYRFDVSDDLAIKIEPFVQTSPVYHSAYTAPAAGITLKLTF